MKTLAAIVVLSVATYAQAQPSIIAIDVTGEHATVSGDTADSARALARVDARRRAWSATAAQLQSHDGVKALQLTPLQIEAFAAILLELEEFPAAATTQGPVQVRLQARMDGNEAARRIALVRKDQDATYDLVEAWVEMQQLHDQLAKDTQLRAGLPSDKASAIVKHQLETVVALDAKHLSARASVALARTEPSAVGGRASSDEGRDRAKKFADAALALSPDSPDAHDVMGDYYLDDLEPEAAEAEFRKARLVEPASSSGRTKLA